MRRAGNEVRVLPDELGSREENPPSLPEFIRDLRWYQGNMRYSQVLRMSGLLPVSRCQRWLAIAMYLSALGCLGFMAVGLIRQGPMRPDLGLMGAMLLTMISASPWMGRLAREARLCLISEENRSAAAGATATALSRPVAWLASK